MRDEEARLRREVARGAGLEAVERLHDVLAGRSGPTSRKEADAVVGELLERWERDHRSDDPAARLRASEAFGAASGIEYMRGNVVGSSEALGAVVQRIRDERGEPRRAKQGAWVLTAGIFGRDSTIHGVFGMHGLAVVAAHVYMRDNPATAHPWDRNGTDSWYDGWREVRLHEFELRMEFPPHDA